MHGQATFFNDAYRHFNSTITETLLFLLLFLRSREPSSSPIPIPPSTCLAVTSLIISARSAAIHHCFVSLLCETRFEQSVYTIASCQTRASNPLLYLHFILMGWLLCCCLSYTVQPEVLTCSVRRKYRQVLHTRTRFLRYGGRA